jgi:hypothetical protein
LFAVILIFVLAMSAFAQQATPATATAGDVTSLLIQVQQTAQRAGIDIARLRIDKWKTDGNNKRQAQQTADSLTRNIENGLPEVLNQVRSAPDNVAAQFKLYRNVTLLYETLNTLVEAAGAFGPRQDVESIATDLDAFDQARRALATHIDAAAAEQYGELARLRSAAPAPREAAAAEEKGGGKRVIDDDEKPAPTPAKKTARKKKKAVPKPPSAEQQTSQQKPQ